MRSWSLPLTTGTATRRLHLVRVAADEVPPDEEWLGDRERATAAALHVARRRADWRLGRCAAKRALALWSAAAGEATDPAPHRLEVLAAPDGAPAAWLDGAPLGAALSLSHRAGHGLAAAADPAFALGCDLELVEPRSAGFVRDFLGPDEQRVIASLPSADRDLAANLAWSAKECALKALRTGLRLDTREARVDLAAALAAAGPEEMGQEWRPLEVSAPGLASGRGGWRREGDLLLCWLAAPRGAVRAAG